MTKPKRRKHLFAKKDRDPKSGYCVTSLWGPFCEICRENFDKKLTKALKNVNFKEVFKNFKPAPEIKQPLNCIPFTPKNNDEEYRKHLIRERSKFIKY